MSASVKAAADALIGAGTQQASTQTMKKDVSKQELRRLFRRGSGIIRLDGWKCRDGRTDALD